MISEKPEVCKEFARLIEIVRTLRGSDGCEWDRAQTSTSLAPYFLEEAYETIEAIHDEDHTKLKEELGDLLLHIVFQSEIAAENNQFHLSESIHGISEKLIRRHPHVFGDVDVKDVSEIKQNWEEIKLKEGRDSLMEGLPKTLPALLRARRAQERAAQVGFDWDKIEHVWDKIHEEIGELKAAVKQRNPENITLELGDLLFSVVNLARFLDINPEQALNLTLKKFIKRFQYIEKELAARNVNLKDATLEEMDLLWNKIRSEDNRKST